MVNVGKYTIHGLFGYWYLAISILLCNTASMKNKSSKYVHNTTITSPQVRVKQNMFFLQTTTKNPSNSWLSDRRFWFSRNTVCPPFIHTSLRWPYLQDLHSIIRMFFFHGVFHWDAAISPNSKTFWGLKMVLTVQRSVNVVGENLRVHIDFLGIFMTKRIFGFLCHIQHVWNLDQPHYFLLRYYYALKNEKGS